MYERDWYQIFIKYKYFLSLLSILIIATIVRLWNISSWLPIFYDESIFGGIWPKRIDQLGVSAIFQENWDNQRNMPLYSIFIASGFLLFKPNLMIGRVFSAMTGVITVLFVFKFGKELYNELIGLLSALVLSLSVYHIWFSRLAVQESLLTMFFTVAIFCYYYGFKRNRNIFILMGGAFFGLAFSTKHQGLIIPIIVGAYLLLNSHHVLFLRLKIVWLSLVVGVLIHSPILLVSATRGFSMYTDPGTVSINTSDLLTIQTLYLRFIYTFSWIRSLMTWPFLLLLIVFFAFFLKVRSPQDILPFCWIVIGILATWPAGFYYPRYIVPVLPAISIGIGRATFEIFTRLTRINIDIKFKKILVILYLIVIASSFINSGIYALNTINSPFKEQNLHFQIREQYLDSRWSGYGLQEAYEYLLTQNFSRSTIIIAAPQFSFMFIAEDDFPRIYSMSEVRAYLSGNSTIQELFDENTVVFVIKRYIQDFYWHNYDDINKLGHVKLEKIIYHENVPEVHILVRT